MEDIQRMYLFINEKYVNVNTLFSFVNHLQGDVMSHPKHYLGGVGDRVV